jgi:class 3 adenylate cyclase
MSGIIDRGRLHPITLRFLDSELEGSYQLEEGAASIGGYRIITAATVLLWAVAAILVPLGTDISPELAVTVGGLMALAGLVCFAGSAWATTMNRQHALASFLTSANGLVILLLADAGGAIEGYAVGAIMLLFLYGFLSRTRFVFATMRTIVIGVGLAVAVILYDGLGSLLIDSFIFVAAALGSLLGLRLLERDRRRVWHQRLVIEAQTTALEQEKVESERLLLNVLPASISKRLRSGEHPIADDFPSVSVVFADIVGFTPLAAKLSPAEVIGMLSGLFSQFDDLVTDRGLEKIKTIGDSYMAVGGLPEPLERHAECVIDLALAMLHCVELADQFAELTLRVGIHSGPAAGGVIGSRKFAYDVWGDTVNIASRLEQAGVPGRVHVSQQTRELTLDRFEFETRGPMELRGWGTMTTYLVVDADS